MNKIKKYITPSITLLILSLLYILSLTTLNYFQVVHSSNLVKINFVLVSLFVFIISLIRGKKTNRKGYLEGLINGGIIVLILFIMNIFFYRVFTLNIVMYYIVIVVSSVFGSIIGKNLKKS